MRGRGSLGKLDFGQSVGAPLAILDEALASRSGAYNKGLCCHGRAGASMKIPRDEKQDRFRRRF